MTGRPGAVWRTGPAGHRAPDVEDALAGARLAVKDLFAVAGERIGAGNPAWLAQAPVETTTASAVARLLAAGCALEGLAQTDELAFSLDGANVHHGTPPNPAAPGHLPGGSTSGPASAVAAGLADVGLGTDTAGSIRVPASYTGLVGLRTTHGAVGRDGLVGLAPSFDTVGLLTRSAALLDAAANVLLPPGDAPAVTGLVVLPASSHRATPQATASFDDAVGALPTPASVCTAVGPDDLDAWLRAFRVVQQSEAWTLHGRFVEAHPGALAAPVEARFRAGSLVDAATERAARTVLADARQVLTGLTADGQVLVLPSTPGPAPPARADATTLDGVRAATVRLTCLASLAGLPALSLPLAHVGGLPLGVCLVGAPGTDRALTRYARHVGAGR